MLKYVRGEHLSHDHWLDLFRMIGLPRGTTLERLTFQDLLAVAPVITANLTELKVGIEKEACANTSVLRKDQTSVLLRLLYWFSQSMVDFD